jgi:hypothetical protein
MDKEEVDFDVNLRPSVTCIRQVNGKGRGVFVSVNCVASSVLEEAHTIEVSPSDFDAVNSTPFRSYYFIRDIAPDGEQGLLVLGNISLLNHSPRPNSAVEFIDTTCGVVARLRALRTIRPGDEVTIDYEVPLWFDYLE